VGAPLPAGAKPPAVAGSTRASSNAKRGTVEATPKIPAGAKRVSSLPGSSSLRVDIILNPPDPTGLAAFARGVSTPGSVDYHHYLTTAQFAARFGPSTAAVATVQGALRSDGLPVGRLSANRLAINLRASAARLARAFSTKFARYRLKSGRVAYANTAPAQLPLDAAVEVQGIVGLDSLVQAQAGAVRVPRSEQRTASLPAAPQVQTGGPQPCAAPQTGITTPAYTADQIAAAYGFPALYQQGDLGQGQTVAVIEGEPNLASDIAAYQSCYGTSTSVRYVATDGGIGSGSGSGEAALDIEQIIGLAPEVHIVVYQSYPELLNLYDEFAQAISADTAKVISTSWGICEALGTEHPDITGDGAPALAATFQAENTLFEEAAAQGQSIVAASGDSGSEACDPDQSYYAGYSSQLTVQDPAAQPFVTGVGGTTLSDPQVPSSETVWNSVGASGGGISDLWPMPSYQSAAPSSVGVVNAYSSGGPCANAGGYCREVPDVSADADPYTGYAIYWDASWWSIGGTSAGAPLWSALLSLTDASSACASDPVGFADPALYAAAAVDPGAFHDITAGNNDFTRTNNGTYPGLAGYDMASGLGSPTANLPAALCRVANPTQLQIVSASSALLALGTPGSLTLTASGTPIAALTETGSLPGGLRFTDNGNGTATVAGIPTQSGVFPIIISAANGSSTATQAFTLAIGSAPAFTSGTTATFSAGVKGLFQVATSGTPTASVTLLSGTLPAGLALTSTGKLEGTPSPSSSGTYSLTLQASNGLAPSATQTLSVVVDGAPTFTSGGTASFAVGARGSFSITTSALPTATLTESGALVPGLVFAATGNGTATIAGTPGLAGLFAVTITATNGDGTTVQTLTVHVAPAIQAPTITSSATTTFSVASYRTFTLHATGSPAPTFSIVSGAVPMITTSYPPIPAVTLSSTGVLSGTPYWYTGGVYRFVVEASNGVSPAALQSFTLIVDEAPGLLPTVSDGDFLGENPAMENSEFTADIAQGAPAHFVLRASGFPVPTLTETGTLPPGTAFSDNGDGTATISGTPTEGGTFSVYITVANVYGGGNTLVALSVAPAVAPSFVTPAAATVLSGGGPAACANVVATGFPFPRLTTQSVPETGWEVVNNDDYYVWDPTSATVCNTGSSSSNQQIFTATNSAGQATQTVNVSVGHSTSPRPFSGPTSAVFQPGAYSAVNLGATDCGYEAPSPQRFPPGLSVSTSGLLSGVPGVGTGGTYLVSLDCIDPADTHIHNSEKFTLVVAGPSVPLPLPPPPTVTPPPEQIIPPQYGATVTVLTTALPLAVAGDRYSASLQATYGGDLQPLTATHQYRWSVVGGQLPRGLRLSKSEGTITGRPARNTAGSFTFTVQVQMKVRTTRRGWIKAKGTGVLSITVVPASRAAPKQGVTKGHASRRR
jgi:hypothetical protein